MRPCTYLDSRQYERCTECGVTIDLCLCSEVNDLANERLTSIQGLFLRSVSAELTTLRQSLPGHLYEQIIQVVGEAGSALVGHTVNRTPEPAHIERVLVRLAALVARLAIDGTPEYSYPAE